MLLAYLILAAGLPLERKQIAFAFWPDSSEKQALSNLRKLLHDFFERLPAMERYLEATSSIIRWRTPPRSDFLEFVERSKGSTIHELKEAEQLFKGELLPGLYEDWIIPKRETISRIYRGVLSQLVYLLEKQRDYNSAIDYANKLLAMDPLCEETCQVLMRLHAFNRDIASVERCYRQLRDHLLTQLDVEPSKETVKLNEKLTKKTINQDLLAAREESTLIGRNREWAVMLQAWSQAAKGKPELLLIRGVSGIGKTKLTLEFKKWVESRGLRTAMAYCSPAVETLSYSPFTTWFRNLPAANLDPADQSELTRLLPELLQSNPELSPPMPIENSWQLRAWYETVERALPKEEPLLLILDNIQWCDRETLQLLAYLLRGDCKANWLVIATLRTDEAEHPVLSGFLSGIRSERKLTEIELYPFDKEMTEQMLTLTIGDRLARRFSAELYTATGGNPLFIVETLREWEVANEPEKYRVSDQVQNAISQRLQRLTFQHQQIVYAAAAVGRPFSLHWIAHVIEGIGEETIAVVIDRLIRFNILRETEMGQYDFSHDKVREVALQQANTRQIREFHRRIARLLTACPDKPLAPAGEIVFHYEQAGEPEAAVPFYKMASEEAGHVYAYETVIQYLQKAYTLIPVGENLPILLKLGEAWKMTGHWNESEQAFKEWLSRSDNCATLRERTYCDVALGDCLRLQGKYKEAHFHLERARHYFELMEDNDGLGLTYGTLGVLNYYTGNNEQALRLLRARGELPLSEDHLVESGRYKGIQGNIYYTQCDYEQATLCFKREIKIAVGTRDRRSIARAMGGLALVYLDTDRMDEAYRSTMEKMRISQSIGDRMGLANAIGILGKYYLLLGCYNQATLCNAYCLEKAISIQDLRVVAIALGLEGCNLMARQQYDEAGQWIDRSLRLSRQLGIPYYECDALYDRCQLEYALRQNDRAHETVQEVWDLAQSLKRNDMLIRLRLIKIELEALTNNSGATLVADQLMQLLSCCRGRQEQALVHMSLWKLGFDSRENQELAFDLNKALYAESGKEEYRLRCQEISGVEVPGRKFPPPDVPVEVTSCSTSPSSLLERVDDQILCGK